MTLHVQVTRTNDLLHVKGQWESRLPLFQNFTLPVVPNETVELAFLDSNMVATWVWSTRTDSPVLEGEFGRMGTMKEVSDSGARFHDLPN